MKKTYRIVILVLILILLCLILRNAYSKYANEANAVKNADIGQWIIKINDQDITEETTTFTIADFTWDWENTPHVKEPKVAPGMKGQFSLKIDPTGTDTSIKYTIKIDETELAKLADINLKITGLKENGTEKELTIDENGELVIEKIKELEKIKSPTEAIDNLEIEVTWEDENTEESNKKDSLAGSVPNTTIQMPVEVNVIQYIPEDTTVTP